MRFGYTILYVDDVTATLAFYDRAFGLKARMVDENGYAELDTGGTVLAFLSRAMLAGMGKATSARGRRPPSRSPWSPTTSPPPMTGPSPPAQRPSWRPWTCCGARPSAMSTTSTASASRSAPRFRDRPEP